MSTQIDLTAIDGVSEEIIADCPQPFIEMLRAITGHFTDLIEEKDDQIDELKETIQDLKETVNNPVSGNQSLDFRVEALSKKSKNISEASFGEEEVPDDFTEDDEAKSLESRLSEMEETGSDGSNPQDETVETPLERVVCYSETDVQQHLSENQERARFIAKDVQDYGERGPGGGHIITSTQMRRVLSAFADDGETIYRTTCDRVMDFLDELGKDKTEKRQNRKNQNIIYFAPGFAKQLNELQRNDVCFAPDPGGALREA